MDDEELVRQVLQGNMGAYVELVRRYTPQIAALCRARVGQPDAVDDLVQETFFRGLDRLADLQKPASFGFWLYSIARNLCREWVGDPHNQLLPLNVTSQGPEAAEEVDKEDQHDRIAALRRCIRHLPTDQREVVEIYYGGSRITYTQLAERLGVGFAQVNRLLTLARKRLRACLERGDDSASRSA